MGIVDDIVAMQNQMAQDRVHFEDAWRDVADLVDPFGSRRFDYRTQSAASEMRSLNRRRPSTIDRGRTRYDSTAAWAFERLSAGMESLTVPRSQKWHGLAADYRFGNEPSDVEEEWTDRTRDYLFSVRYDARSNFALAAQKSIRGVCAYGTGILYSEENLGRKNIDPVSVPFFYRNIPVSHAYMGIDAFETIDRFIRIEEWPARACVDYFGEENVSDRVKEWANNPNRMDQIVSLMQAVVPREMSGEFSGKRRNQPFGSFWIETETRHLIRASGFNSFPFHVMWWDQTDASPYGQSPVMGVLAEIKMLQHMNKAMLQAAQQLVRPPTATMPGIYAQRLNLNTGANNPGYIDEQGRMKVQPILTGANPSWAQAVIQERQNVVKEGMMTNVFMQLLEDPKMTATQVLVKQQQKGEMVGPAGAKIENGLANAIDREINIIANKGAFEQGSALEPPESMLGREVNVKWTSPLALIRRIPELQGINLTLEQAANLGQYDPTVLDRIDTEESIEITREISGAPRRMFRQDEEVEVLRQQRMQQMAQQQALEATSQLAKAAGDATPAIQAVQESAGAA